MRSGEVGADVPPLTRGSEFVTFSVVIPTMGRPSVLNETLASIMGGETVPKEVIVVDADPSGSALPVSARFRSQDTGVVISHLMTSPGIPHQRNRGMREASGDVVVFLDDDVFVHPRLFSVLTRAYRDGSIVGATGRVLEPPAHRFGGPRSRVRRLIFDQGREGSFTRFGYPRYVSHVDRAMDVQVMPGCFMSARMEAATRVGFDPMLPGYALGEDEDFAVRLSRLGRIRYLPEAVVRHKKLGFASRDPRAFGREVAINRTYLFRKNFERTPLARAQFGMLMLVLLLHRFLNGDFSGVAGLLEGGWIAWRRNPTQPSA